MYSLQVFSVYDIDVYMFDGIESKHDVYRDKRYYNGRKLYCYQMSKRNHMKRQKPATFLKKVQT